MTVLIWHSYFRKTVVDVFNFLKIFIFGDICIALAKVSCRNRLIEVLLSRFVNFLSLILDISLKSLWCFCLPRVRLVFQYDDSDVRTGNCSVVVVWIFLCNKSIFIKDCEVNLEYIFSFFLYFKQSSNYFMLFDWPMY